MKAIKPRNLEQAGPQATTGKEHSVMGMHEGQAVEVLP